jgi:hypothetical protein
MLPMRKGRLYILRCASIYTHTITVAEKATEVGQAPQNAAGFSTPLAIEHNVFQINRKYYIGHLSVKACASGGPAGSDSLLKGALLPAAAAIIVTSAVLCWLCSLACGLAAP